MRRGVISLQEFPILTPALQIGFFQRLKVSENEFLLPALLSLIGDLDISKIDQELLELAHNEKIAFVAKKGLRGELVYPIPYIIRSKPTLLGYYRLLLGFSQKEFYKGQFSKFKIMESKGLSPQEMMNC